MVSYRSFKLRSARRTTWFACVVLVFLAGSANAEAPLHQRIDAAVGVGNAKFEQVAADDAGGYRGSDMVRFG